MARRPIAGLEWNRLAYLAATRGNEQRVIAYVKKRRQEKEYRALVAELQGGSKRSRMAAELIAAFDRDAADAIRVLRALDKKLWRPAKPPRHNVGAPKVWDNGNVLFAWLAVEARHRADQHNDSKAQIKHSIERLFDALPRADRVKPGLCVRDNPPLHITVSTAKAYHAAGARLLQAGGPALRRRWGGFADREALDILSRAKK